MKKPEKWIESQVQTKQGTAIVYHPAGHPAENFIRALGNKFEFPTKNDRPPTKNQEGVAFSRMGKRGVVLKPFTPFLHWVDEQKIELQLAKDHVKMFKHLNEQNASVGVPLAVIHFPAKKQSNEVTKTRTLIMTLRHNAPTLRKFLASNASYDHKLQVANSAFRLLGRLHALGYVHLDVHEENILVVGKKAKLIDSHGVHNAENSGFIRFSFDGLISNLRQFDKEDRNKFELVYRDSFEKAKTAREKR